MMKNVNQVCGVLALIAVACLVAFGSAGDRIVSAAPGQIAPAGDTGQAIALGGCNRCAWSLKSVTIPGNYAAGNETVIFPRGTSGAIRWVSISQESHVVADCMEPGATGTWISPWDLRAVPGIDGDQQGIRFVDGFIVVPQINTVNYRVTLEYRLD